MIRFLASLFLLVLSAVMFTGCGSTDNPAILTIQLDNDTGGSSITSNSSSNTNLIQPEDLVYRGAFRLPGNGERPHTFSYGGAALTYNPRGNPEAGPGENPGSLFIMGHNRMPYGELPDGNQVSEISIPLPVVSESVNTLNQARFIQPFENVLSGFYPTLNEIPRAGMQYLETSATGPLVHLAFGQHMQEDAENIVASHAWFSPDLSAPATQGTWHIGHQSPYSVNEYIFEIPSAWAEEHTGGRLLATGRFKDGGWSGMGPALFAYQPWIDSAGTPAAPNTRLEETTLLLYQSSRHTENITRCLTGYQHPDEWAGGAWLTGNEGRAAVLFAGTKSIGERYWYGFINPGGPEYACVESAFIGQFTLCRLADGTPCPDESSATCEGHTSNRGWWTNQFQARFILYNPDDLAAVAGGEIEPWEPQPYAFLDIDRYLFLNPAAIEPDMLGTGSQRRYRLGDVAYDRENGWIYVLELYVDQARPVIHTFKIEGTEPPEDDPGEWIIITVPEDKILPKTAWRINFSRSFSPADIDLIEIVYNSALIPLDLEMFPKDAYIIINPLEEYLPGTEYELRIQLSNSRKYKMPFSIHPALTAQPTPGGIAAEEY